MIVGDNGQVLVVSYGSGGLVSVDEISSEVSATDSLGGADTMYGDGGNDLLVGGAAGDTIYGNTGLRCHCGRQCRCADGELDGERF